MKQRSLSVVTIMGLICLTACMGGGGGGGSSIGGAINSNIISGVAATGAPISNGRVLIKGKDGDEVETTTGSDGTYSANISDLQEPYLVKVLAPSGEKYISVATQSALAEGKKVNVTPVSHIIVANVFETADPDELFAEFTTMAANFQEDKIDEEKDKLKQKFIDAGLIGGVNGVVGEDVDLLNGTLVAGTSQGLDGLLDVLDVNTGGASGIEVKLKVGEAAVPIFTDNVVKVNGSDQDVPVSAVDSNKLVEAKAQLSVLDIARAFLNNFAQIYSSFATCSGNPYSPNYTCNLNTIESTLAPHFDAAFQENGNSSIWGWICDSNVQTQDQCTELEFGVIQLKDVNLVSFNPTSKKAIVSFNVYENGALGGTNEFVLQGIETNGSLSGFKLLGNQKTFRYWIETSSEHLTESVWNGTTMRNELQDKYQVNLNMWFDTPASYSFNGSEVFTISALSGNDIFQGANGLTDSMSIYLVKAPNYDSGNCVSGISFSTSATPYQQWDQTTGTVLNKSYNDACPNIPNPCDCQAAYFNYESTRLILSAAQVQNMSKIERISMTNASHGINDEFIIKKPLIVSSFTASSYMPQLSLSAEAFCQNTNPNATLELSSPTGVLNYLSIFYSTSKFNQETAMNEWHQDEAKAEYWDENRVTASFTPVFENIPAGSQLNYRYLFLESRDDNDQTFVRRINCATIQ